MNFSMVKKVGKIFKLLTSVAVTLIVILAMLLVGVRLFGLQVYTVLSGSMEPNYKTGSLIYVKDVDPVELSVDDVITFKLSENTTATHRIIDIVFDEENNNEISFRTKGDANDTPDGSLVASEDVIGVPIFTIPYMGYVASFIQRPPGMYISIAVSIAIMLLVFIGDILIGDKKEKNNLK
ncbi:MAG: signal peptidase I [Acutalibacteraceae bacterium]|nr:signal peptidase I [Acutalibacteraceae bacterium]